MSRAGRNRLAKLVDAQEHLDRQRRAFVAAYLASFDPKQAAEAVGAESPMPFLKDSNVIAAIDRGVQESELSAEYVRQYIAGVMEFCPTDYFELTPDGHWTIDPVKFRSVPNSIRRFVESVELKKVGRERVFVVKFVSKTAALALAVKLTSTQKFKGKIGGIPWELVAEAEVDTVDKRLEAEIRALVPAEGSAAAR